MKAAVLSFSLFLAAVPPCLAGPPGDADRLTWSLGVGAVVSPRPYVGADAEVFPIPLFGVEYRSFFLRGVRMGFEGRLAERVRASGFLTPRFDGYEADDSPALQGMADRDTSVDLGVALDFEWDHVELGLEALADVLDESGGRTVGLSVGFPVPVGAWRVTPRLGAEWLSSDTVDHYYGVRPEEAKADRPPYAGEAALNWTLGLTVGRRWKSGWAFTSRVEWEALGDEISESPIVDDDSVMSGFMAVVRTF